MKPTKRALRRHHRARMLQRALRSLVLSGTYDEQERRSRALGWYNNLKKCSCWMCGNPRKYEGKVTLQERRLAEAARDDAETAQPAAAPDSAPPGQAQRRRVKVGRRG
jgi:hypothetical protein